MTTYVAARDCQQRDMTRVKDLTHNNIYPRRELVWLSALLLALMAQPGADLTAAPSMRGRHPLRRWR